MGVVVDGFFLNSKIYIIQRGSDVIYTQLYMYDEYTLTDNTQLIIVVYASSCIERVVTYICLYDIYLSVCPQ